jgi:phosphatidylserine/phosphatidylglycerophosphate/cardiolipin synthase-like enzyme
MNPLRGLSRPALLQLAQALETGSVSWPPSVLHLRRLGLDASPALVDELSSLGPGKGPALFVAYTLRLLAEERADSQRSRDRIDLVWTGPEGLSARTRDTLVVVRELFQKAQSSVLVSTYAIAQGQEVFEPLARAMDARLDLVVQFFLNVPRPYQDPRADSLILAESATVFRSGWPGHRLPEVFYDPRSLSSASGGRVSLHAKCIVVDDRWAFVTSANFTEAAQQRNIEAGVLVDDEGFAHSLRAQFDGLVTAGTLRRL